MTKLSGKTKGSLILIGLLTIFVIDVVKYFKIPEDTSERHELLLIPKGSALSQVADSLFQKGLVDNKKLFIFWATTLGYDKKIRAGMFKIPYGMNNAQLARYLGTQRSLPVRVTLIEGWPTSRILNTLADRLGLNEKKLDSLATNPYFCQTLGLKQNTLTGYLLPDTYFLDYGKDERSLLSFLVHQTLKIFQADSIRQAMRTLGMSRHQILILASIIEGEAMKDNERPIIASVYYNRLKRHMKLQADPTIQFLLKGDKRRLLYKDLKIDSPYNTYLHYGLPPAPINNPGRASIIAALFPARTKYLYFVASGDGGHVFCRTATEHLRAKRAFNKIRRKVAREKRARLN